MGQQHSVQISTFKTAFDGGTRPNRFEIMIPAPNDLPDVDSVLVKAGSMPPETVGIINIPYRGRLVKFPGDRTYAEWTVTVIDTAEPNNRSMFEMWHEQFNQHVSNAVDSTDILTGTNTTYFKEVTVQQVDMTGTPIKERLIKLINCWPVAVGAINLSYDTADTLVEYSITFAYDYLIGDGDEETE